MKKSLHQLTFLALFFVFQLTISKAQEIEWDRTIGGSSIDHLSSMKHTPDGGYICGGFSNSDISYEKNENTIGYGDYWIVKLDSFGRIQWQNTVGGYGNGPEYLFSISNCLLGGYICGGFSESNSSADKSENCIGGWDYWVVKLDSAGNIEWENTIGGTGGGNGDRLYSVSQAYDGSFYCGGYSYSDSSADKSENSIGNNDFWILKLNSTGLIQWENTIGGSGYEELHSVFATADGGVICGGWSASNISGDKTENPIGGAGADFWVVKLDSLGNILWQNTIGGNSMDILSSISQTKEGGYICGGYSDSDISGDKTENCQGNLDYWIVKLDSAGNIQWQQTIGGDSTDILTSIIQTADGGYFCGGNSKSSVSGDKIEGCKGNDDFWILKLDSSGNIEWQNTIGYTGNDNLTCVDITNDGNYICGGYSKSDISGDKSTNHHSVVTDAGDFWIAKITDRYSTITGKLFIDFNSNSFQDSGDFSLANKRITEINSHRVAFSDHEGHYSIVVLDTGVFSVSPDVSFSNYYATPTNHTATITTLLKQADTLNDFAYQPSGIINDLCVTMTPRTLFRSGFYANYEINYVNYGTTSMTGDVIFFLDTNIVYVSATTSPTSVTADSIVWNTGLLSPFQSGSFIITVHINPGLPIGTLIYPIVRIEPLAGDANPACNVDSWEIYTTGSSDPNDILVNPDSVSAIQLSTPPFFEYLIRFQNVGNDTAFTVNIFNTIDTTRLDLTSFELISASHPVQLIYHNWRNLEFDFDNILLPDKNTNGFRSRGFVRYRIKPKTTVQAGDSIINNAIIYFDFNLGIRTNNAITKITVPNSYNSISVSDCNSYLSPSGNYLWTTSGIYIDSLPNAAGYDSIITITLTLNKTFSTINPNVCDTFISPSNNYTWTTTGLFHDTIPNAAGCDSIITINLSINNNSSTINLNACDSFTSPSGNYTWISNGTYLDTIPNTTGCDSVITINLTINKVDTSVTVNNSSLISNASGATYQWIYCDSVAIAGANSQSFIASANGSYAIIVSQNGCLDTSLCYAVTGVGIIENKVANEIVVKPNPANHSITIQCLQHSSINAQLIIFDPFGRVVYYSKEINRNSGKDDIVIDISNFAGGLYFVQLDAGKQMFRTKFVKQ